MLGAVAKPLNQELPSATVSLRINYFLDRVFFKTVWHHDGSRLFESAQWKQDVVIGMVRFQMSCMVDQVGVCVDVKGICRCLRVGFHYGMWSIPSGEEFGGSFLSSLLVFLSSICCGEHHEIPYFVVWVRTPSGSGMMSLSNFGQ